jgi:nicotinate-nucleotide adenylyltransferase
VIGILGGTFNPIHHAHLRLAEELGDALDMHSVRVIPASIPPHRKVPHVSIERRLDMVRLACAGNPRLVVDDRECRRAGPSYTVDTLRELRTEQGSEEPLCLLMGVDAFAALTMWSRWQELFELTHIAIAERPGFVLAENRLPAELADHMETRLAQELSELHKRPAGSIALCAITALDISATAIRSNIAQGKSVRYLLPDSVLDYIRQHQLYKDLDAR